MKNLNFTFKSIVQSKARWLLTLFAILTLGVGQMWGATQTIYVSGRIFSGSWDYSTSSMKVGYWKNTASSGNQWVDYANMTPIGKTFHTFPVYSCSVTSSTNYAQIYFKHYTNGTATGDPNYQASSGGDWVDFNSNANRLYNGYYDDKHNWLSSPTYDTQETVTIYYALDNTENYTIKANMRVSQDYSVWETVTMTNTGKTYAGKKIYSCDITLYRGGLQYLQFQRYDNSTFKDQAIAINNSWTTKATFNGKLYYGSSWKTLATKRTYDGNTYIYWKTSGNDIPVGWGSSGSSTNAIQLFKITSGSYTYSGFQNGEDIGYGFYRYLVPAGDYADVVEIRGKNGSYTGEFGFPSDAAKNEIWNYKASENWASWAQTYFAKNAYVYFDNTSSNWGTGSGNYNYLLPGGGGYSDLYALTPIDNTNLLCYISGFSYNDFLELVFIHTSSSWSGTSGNPNDRKGYADNRTASLPKMMDCGSKLYNLYTPSGSGAKASTEASLTHTSASSYGGLLNSNQTVNTVVKTTDSYVSANSKAPISLGSYALSSATAATASVASLTTGESTDNVSSCKTATTTFTVDEANLADGYQFDGWFAAATGGSALETNATYSYTTTGAKTVYARFSAINYNVTYSAPTNGNYTIQVASGSATSATKTAILNQTISIVATPSNQGYYFTGWTIRNTSTSADETSTLLDENSTNANTSFTMPTHSVTITANFAPRFGLEGSLNEDADPAGGMPGWVHEDAADFEVIGFTGLGESGVNLRCTLTTIHPNKEYKFRVYDRERGARLGATSADYLLNADASVQLSVVGEDPANNVVIYTVGYGTYIFHITKLSNPDVYPTIEVIRQVSSQLTLGWKHYTNGTLSNGNTGGTVTAVTNEGSGFAITNDQFYANESDLTFTAEPAEGYHVEGWYSNADCSTAYVNGSGGATISGDGNVILTLSSVSTNKTVYVKFAEDTKTFSASSGNNWSETANWTGGSVPTINDVVILTAPVTVDVAHAKAKRVVIDQSSDNTGKLTVNANKGLEVTETIRVKKGDDLVITSPADLILESSAAGNATLIFDNSDEDHLDEATVDIYSKGTISGGTWNWQYVGTPYQGSKPLYNYYGSYMYKWNNTYSRWDVVSGDDVLEPFAGYCMTQDEATTHSMNGTLVPTTSYSVDIAKGKSMVLANSWTAPIYIGGFTASTFSSYPATIYLFNAGMSAEGASAAGKDKYAAGTYVAIPVNAGSYTGDEFIAPMQGFFVTTTGGSGAAGTITLNYNDLVRPADSRGIVAGAMHAPKHNKTAEEGAPAVMKIWADGATYNDRVVILAREDFSTGFDNGWDGKKLSFSSEAPSVYVINEQGEYEAVSAIPEFEGTVVGFRAGTGSDFSIRFEYNGEEELYLNDLKDQRSVRIDTENTYTFNGLETDSEARFIISATPINAPSIATSVSELNDGSNARKVMINDILYIIRGGKMYTPDGQIVK